jgi:hypothetical protein
MNGLLMPSVIFFKQIKWVTLLPFLIAHFCHVEARESIFFFFKSSRLDDLGKEKSDTNRATKGTKIMVPFAQHLFFSYLQLIAKIFVFCFLIDKSIHIAAGISTTEKN